MKKRCTTSIAARITALFIMTLFIYTSCDFGFYGDLYSPPKITGREGNIARQIQSLNTSEILKTFRELKAEDTDGIFSEVDEEMLYLFLNNPMEALALIAQEENGEEQLQLIDVMFNNGTVDEAIHALEALSPELADEYVNSLEELADALGLTTDELTLSRSAASTSKPSIRNIPLILSNDRPSTGARSAYAADLEWSTIAWYAGFCVATALGAFAIDCWWMPWLVITGIVAVTAGTISMIVQIVQWRDCSDLWAVVGALVLGNVEKCFEILISSEHGWGIITILAVTAATGVALCYTKTGKAIYSLVAIAINTIKDLLNGSLPAGMLINSNGSITVNGIIATEAPKVDVPTSPGKKKFVWWNPLTWF